MHDQVRVHLLHVLRKGRLVWGGLLHSSALVACGACGTACGAARGAACGAGCIALRWQHVLENRL